MAPESCPGSRGDGSDRAHYDRPGRGLASDGDIVYGTPGGNDAIVGLTEGNGAADPGPTDLSAAGAMPAAGTTYEQFSSGGFDLHGMTLVFLGM